MLAARRVNDEKRAILLVVVAHREFAEIHGLCNRAQLEAMNHAQAVALVGEQLPVIVVGASRLAGGGPGRDDAAVGIAAEFVRPTRAEMTGLAEITGANLEAEQQPGILVSLLDQVVCLVVGVAVPDSSLPPDLDQPLLRVVRVLADRASGVRQPLSFSSALRYSMTVRPP